jgi:hypothetical protein
MRIEISIERLVLHGMSVASARRLCAALESELARLVAERGLPHPSERDAHRRRLQAPRTPLPAVADARAGRGLARSVYRALGHLERPGPDTAHAVQPPSTNR